MACVGVRTNHRLGWAVVLPPTTATLALVALTLASALPFAESHLVSKSATTGHPGEMRLPNPGKKVDEKTKMTNIIIS